MDEGYQPTKMQKFKRFIKECYRVLKVTKKPDSVEYKTIVKVSALGIGIIGLLGFLIQLAAQLIKAVR